MIMVVKIMLDINEIKPCWDGLDMKGGTMVNMGDRQPGGGAKRRFMDAVTEKVSWCEREEDAEDI